MESSKGAAACFCKKGMSSALLPLLLLVLCSLPACPQSAPTPRASADAPPPRPLWRLLLEACPELGENLRSGGAFVVVLGSNDSSADASSNTTISDDSNCCNNNSSSDDSNSTSIRTNSSDTINNSSNSNSTEDDSNNSSSISIHNSTIDAISNNSTEDDSNNSSSISISNSTTDAISNSSSSSTNSSGSCNSNSNSTSDAVERSIDTSTRTREETVLNAMCKVEWLQVRDPAMPAGTGNYQETACQEDSPVGLPRKEFWCHTVSQPAHVMTNEPAACSRLGCRLRLLRWQPRMRRCAFALYSASQAPAAQQA